MVIKTPRSRTSTLLPVALAAAALAAGCGGGGDSGGAAGTSLAFSVAWEQRADPALGVSAGPDDLANFDTPIPPSVNAIRFILRPSLGADCCVAVLRGSPEFIERRIQLADVSPGEGTLEVNGFPTGFAPAAGVTATCATRSGGTACSSQDTLPSFGSDEIDIDLIAGEVNVVEVDVHSLPFLLDLDPEDGETVGSQRPRVDFAVVDANHDIDPDVDILIEDGEGTTPSEILTAEECFDNDPELPDCSEDGELEVRGLLITSRPEENLSTGVAGLRIRASNEAPTPRDMESNTTFIVLPDDTTTTTIETTTTSTTLGIPETFCLEFAVNNAVDLIGISFVASYGDTGGDFTGNGENVSCFSLLETNPNSTLTTFNDDEEAATLAAAVISAETFSGPVALAQCEFSQVPPLVLGNFSIQVTEATAPDLSSTSATVVVTETTCPF
ncbi:MAG: hypothetical protein ABR587_04075 [Candidatus Binatia bacterium]